MLSFDRWGGGGGGGGTKIEKKKKKKTRNKKKKKKNLCVHDASFLNALLYNTHTHTFRATRRGGGGGGGEGGYHLVTKLFNKERNSSGFPLLLAFFAPLVADGSPPTRISALTPTRHKSKATPLKPSETNRKEISGTWKVATERMTTPIGTPRRTVFPTEGRIFPSLSTPLRRLQSPNAPRAPNKYDADVQPRINGDAVPTMSIGFKPSPWLARPIVANTKNEATSPANNIARRFRTFDCDVSSDSSSMFATPWNCVCCKGTTSTSGFSSLDFSKIFAETGFVAGGGPDPSGAGGGFAFGSRLLNLDCLTSPPPLSAALLVVLETLLRECPDALDLVFFAPPRFIHRVVVVVVVVVVRALNTDDDCR